MIALPAPIREYLSSTPPTDSYLCYLKIDSAGVLCDHGGELAHYGLDALSDQIPIDEQIGFLHGLIPLNCAMMELPIFEISPDRYANIHLFADKSSCWILLLDCTVEALANQRLQQSRNSLESGGVEEIDFRESEIQILRCVLSHLDVAIFEHRLGDLFLLIGDSPEWLESVDKHAARGRHLFTRRHHFINDFLFEAENIWSKAGTGDHATNIWQVDIASKSELSIEVSAMRFGTRKLLLLRSLGKNFEQHHAVLQQARETSLAFESLESQYLSEYSNLREENIELSTRATTDDLTKLRNRLGFRLIAGEHMKQSVQTGEPLLLIFIDMDNFKTINDTLGHQVGDLALVKTADALRSVFRESDAIARLGGDEFAILAPRANEVTAIQFIERLRSVLANFNANEDIPFPLLFSVGYTQYDASKPESLDEFIARVDALMYRNKKSKNRSTHLN